MKIPKMIIFDYGQTLVNEQKMDGVKGTEAVLKYATKNKHNLTAKQVQQEANNILSILGIFDSPKKHSVPTEIPNTMFNPYLYESQGIELPLSTDEIDYIFWNAAAPGVPTDGMAEFLDFLKEHKIRTAVISNISYSQKVVTDQINRLLPNNDFEFIITSSNYIFRKPHKRIFDLALEKADLSAEDVWYIGDKYEADIEGAAGVGITPIWYIGASDLPYTAHKNIITIKEWSELEKMMI